VPQEQAVGSHADRDEHRRLQHANDEGRAHRAPVRDRDRRQRDPDRERLAGVLEQVAVLTSPHRQRARQEDDERERSCTDPPAARQRHRPVGYLGVEHRGHHAEGEEVGLRPEASLENRVPIGVVAGEHVAGDHVPRGELPAQSEDQQQGGWHEQGDDAFPPILRAVCERGCEQHQERKRQIEDDLDGERPRRPDSGDHRVGPVVLHQ